MKIKKRLDVLLVEQGYADTRSKAQAIIMSGLWKSCIARHADQFDIHRWR